MNPEWLVMAGALGCGIIAGVFFAFSTFVMQALARLPERDGMAAMQAINVTVLNPWFLGVFIGTAAVCLALGILMFTGRLESNPALVYPGAALYIVGTFAVTAAANVPLNDRLGALTPDDPAGIELWKHYLSRWTFWNHVRTGAAVAACVLLILA